MMRLKIFKSPIGLRFSREHYIDIIVLLGISVGFLTASLYQIELPGLYGDELDKLVPTVDLLTGRPFLGVGLYRTLFGVRILLSFTDRIGPVLSYLPMPFILVFGYTPFALRFSAILCAWLTLIFGYFGAKIWFGPKVARYGIILTAVSPVFVFSQRMGYYNYGPVTLFTSLTFFFLARYISKRNVYDLWASAAFAGVVIDTALHGVFVLIPMFLIAALFWNSIRPRVRELGIALCIFVMVGSPIIAMTLKSGAAFQRMGWRGSDSAALTLRGLVDTFSREIFYFEEMIGGLDALQTGILGRHIDNLWMDYAFGLSILILAFFFAFARDKIDFIRRSGAPFIITCMGLAFTGLITTSHVTYQLIVLWPFAFLIIGAALARVYKHPGRFGLVTIGLVGALVATQANVTIKAHQLLSNRKGRVYTSSMIYPLADYFRAMPELHPIAMDWGLLNQIYYLTGGKVLPTPAHGWWPKEGAPPDEFSVNLLNYFRDPNNVYVFLAPGKGMFDRYFHFERLARLSGREVYLEKKFYEDDGTIAYRLYRVSKPGEGNAKKDACLESVAPGKWKGEYFPNKTLTMQPVKVRDDGDGFINFNWDWKSPDAVCGVGPNDFSARWTRTIRFNKGIYLFKVTSDDGFKLFVDNRLVLDKWFDQPPTTYTADVALQTGDHTLTMEYYQAGGQARASLSWATR